MHFRGAMHDDLSKEIFPFVPDQEELLNFANSQWEVLLAPFSNL